MIAALAFLLWNLGTPLHGAHVFRQTLVVSGVHSLMHHGVLAADDCADLGMGQQCYDFPLCQATAALLGRALGLTSVAASRVTNIAVFLFGIWALRWLLRRVAASSVVIDLATVFAAIAPLHLHYSGTPLPDPLVAVLGIVLLGSVAGALCDGGAASRRMVVVAMVCAFLGALVKASVVLPAVVGFAILVLRAHGRRAFRLGAFWCVGTAAAAGLLTFLVANEALNANWTSAVEQPPFDRAYWFFGSTADRLVMRYYGLIGEGLAKYLLNPVTMLLALCAFTLGWRRAASGPARLGSAWALGALASTLVFFNVNWRHNYYQVPWIAPLAVLAAVGCEWVVRWWRDKVPQVLTVAVVVLGALWSAQNYLQRISRADEPENAVARERGAAIAAATRPDDLVIFILPPREHGSQQPWFAQRGGCCLDAQTWDNEQVQRTIARLPVRDRYMVSCRDARDAARLADAFLCSTLAETPFGPLIAVRPR